MRRGAVMGVWLKRRGLAAGACAAALATGLPNLAGAAGAAAQPWMNRKLSPDARAELVLKRLDLDQQIALLHGYMPVFMGPKKPPQVVMSAGYLPGIPGLGVPDLTESDASLGVASAGRK